jgi:hypothetical protein
MNRNSSGVTKTLTLTFAEFSMLYSLIQRLSPLLAVIAGPTDMNDRFVSRSTFRQSSFPPQLHFQSILPLAEPNAPSAAKTRKTRRCYRAAVTAYVASAKRDGCENT